MKFKKMMDAFSGYNFRMRVNNYKMQTITEDVAHCILDRHCEEWSDVEVASWDIIEGIFCIRLKI